MNTIYRLLGRNTAPPSDSEHVYEDKYPPVKKTPSKKKSGKSKSKSVNKKKKKTRKTGQDENGTGGTGGTLTDDTGGTGGTTGGGDDDPIYEAQQQKLEGAEQGKELLSPDTKDREQTREPSKPSADKASPNKPVKPKVFVTADKKKIHRVTADEEEKTEFERVKGGARPAACKDPFFKGKKRTSRKSKDREKRSDSVSPYAASPRPEGQQSSGGSNSSAETGNEDLKSAEDVDKSGFLEPRQDDKREEEEEEEGPKKIKEAAKVTVLDADK